MVAKKKLGNAIVRNKIKRRIKNIMRDVSGNIKINSEYSYLIIAKKNVFNDKFEDIKAELFLNFKKSNNENTQSTFIYIIKFYRFFISPLFYGSCKFEPILALTLLNVLEIIIYLKQFLKSTVRIIKCNPWFNTGGYDPIKKRKVKNG